jgi:hypothetical protein
MVRLCATEAAENEHWLTLALKEFNEVLENNPSERDRNYAADIIRLIHEIRK